MLYDTKWMSSNESAICTPLQAHAKLFGSMFAREDAGELHLERCMRLLPHQADTGGFFVAVLQKVAELPPSAFVTAPTCDLPPSCSRFCVSHGAAA